MTRQFETYHAVRTSVPFWLGLFSSAGAGKTFSLLRLATGMQSVVGGEIHMIDTEGGRGLHYSDRFSYEYTPLAAPFGADDYIAAIEHVAAKGARIIIVDQMSSEHDGEGGLLDSHEKELDRMAGTDWKKREAVKMLAWGRPKAARKRLLQKMLGLKDVYFLLGFRADETAKPVKNKETGKNEVLQMGFTPICGKNFIYEATVSTLLLPGAKGVPTWNPEGVGSRVMVKLPEQFVPIFKPGEQLSEKHGEALARWAKGGSAQPPSDLSARAAAVSDALRKANSIPLLEKAWTRSSSVRSELELTDKHALDQISLLYEARTGELQEAK